MFNQKSIIVLYIDRGRLQFFGGSLPTVMTLDIPGAIVRDLEVVNKDALYTFIKQWIKQVNLQSGQLVIVIGESTYFEKVIEPTEAAFLETEAIKFFDTVPFESIWTKIFPQDKIRRAVAVNKTYIDAICQAFFLQGFQTRAVVPMFALGPLAVKRALDAQMGEYVVRSIDTLSKYTLMDTSGGSSSLESPKGESGALPPNKNLALLLGAFGFLLLILVIVALTQLK
jgi:hypothetical protein